MRCSPNKVALLLFVFLCPIVAVAQSSSNKNALQAYDRAKQELARNNYPGAITDLKEAVKADPAFLNALQQLGDLYRLTKSYTDAITTYRRVIALDPEFFRGTWLGLAESELATGEYNPALEHFKKYRGYAGLSPETGKRIDKYIADCEFSIAAVKNPVPFVPENLGPAVNTANPEYLPVVTADEQTLIFTRQSQQNEDLYQGEKRNGKWQQAVSLGTAINTPTLNEGAQCISPDGLYLFYTVCNRPGGLGSCDIYLSKKEGTAWSAPFNLGPPVNTRGWESQPSISADGKTLYFTSNRAGGLGGYDIWKSELQEGGSWSAPVNLGPNVNTAYDEQSPFIHPDNQTLYFSSNGWPGLGDKDLFLSRKDEAGNWGKPENLGYPINSFGEEAGITLSSDGKTAFFNAVRAGGYGSQDIYSFPVPEKLRPAPVTYVKGTVFDKATKEFLSAGIKITDVSTGNVVYDDRSGDEKGDFMATMPAGKTYALTITQAGYVFYSASFTLKEPSSLLTPFSLDVPLEKINIGATTVLNNLFFDTNKYELLPESKEELQQLLDFLNLNPSVSIEIGGYTDNVGEEKANQLLSENRARSVYTFLLGQKIPASRLTFKGYGESSPLADNNTAEGRKNNRRTGFKVIKN